MKSPRRSKRKQRARKKRFLKVEKSVKKGGGRAV